MGTGEVSGVTKEIWEFTVSGWPVLQRWLGWRTRRGIGKGAAEPVLLDAIRPTEWIDEWNVELLELVTVLKRTLELYPEAEALLGDVMDGPLVSQTELPAPGPHERKEPKV